MKYLLVFNPKARHCNPVTEATIVAQASEILRSRDIVVAHTIQRADGQMVSYDIDGLAAHQHDVDCVVAVGGDGTINIAASALMRYGLESRVPLGVVPYGTGNNLVRSFGLWRNSAKALGTIREMKLIDLDIGIINRAHYFINTSFGFFAYIVPRRVTTSWFGWTYDVLRNVRFVPRAARIRYWDAADRPVELPSQAYLVGAVLNTSYYGSILHMAPDVRCDDGLFDVKLIRAAPYRDYPLLLTVMLTGGYQLSARTLTFRARRLDIEPDQTCYFETDGDGIPLQEHYRIEMAGQIKLIVPTMA